MAILSTRCFNSRAREGRDSRCLALTLLVARFNSRAREGRDRAQQVLDSFDCVSIHAPVRGATTATGPSTVPSVFQFTRP